MANIGGAATFVGDPPNIIIARRANVSLMNFLLIWHRMVIIVVMTIIS
jgi:Na+/H+ antiporter NhaD/arsenite permease-like protein